MRNEVNPKSAELLQSEYKLLNTAGESVKPPDHHDIAGGPGFESLRAHHLNQ